MPFRMHTIAIVYYLLRSDRASEIGPGVDIYVVQKSALKNFSLT